MAKDVPNKTVSSNNNSGNTSPSQSDQQKVPPLRIVLHTSGNQKNQSTTAATTTPTSTNSNTTAAPNQQQPSQPQPSDQKREKPPDNNGSGIKSGGRVRIRLGTNRQQAGAKGANHESNSTNNSKTGTDTAGKGEGGLFKEEINASFGHLRRITRRSHRSVQAISNEDEESISSMTSTDENQITTATTTASATTGATTTTTTSTSAGESATSGQDAATASSSSASSGNNQSSSTTAETPRRYKRRKGETSEILLNECSAFGFQNYMVPVQNSFELFKNIRKQVDKKLDTLSNVHPKSPRGFRDYMLARGAYLLHGNRLGNGTNLYMNEDGGLNAMPMSKFHALKQSRFYYSVPNRAKVPLGLPINSPLYDLFIEQEKERYRMRMQHIKEREKLTLAAEQEIMRVYNQAALAAADQPEPFSACTMLKHQEIYNYMDSDGSMIQSSEEDQQDQQAKQDGVRTRRRQHEQIAPSPGRRNASNDQTNEAHQKDQSKQQTVTDQNAASPSDKDAKAQATEENDKAKKRPAENDSNDSDSKDEAKVKREKESAQVKVPAEGDDIEADSNESLSSKADDKTKEVVSNADRQEPATSVGAERKVQAEDTSTNTTASSSTTTTTKTDNQSDIDKKICNQASGKLVADMELDGRKEDVSKANETSLTPADSAAAAAATNESDPPVAAMPEQQTDELGGSGGAKQESGADGSGSSSSEEPVLSDDIRRAYNKRIFLSQLQLIDDKWDKIRGEMLIRHRNEAESLHAVQRLEWEWKTKEIGACDVRTTPVIDNTLVPKLSIYSQDY